MPKHENVAVMKEDEHLMRLGLRKFTIGDVGFGEVTRIEISPPPRTCSMAGSVTIRSFRKQFFGGGRSHGHGRSGDIYKGD